jgi:hypothetical protein
MTEVAELLPALEGRSPFISDNFIGFEPVTRAARLVLFQGLDDEIDRQSERWNEEDLALQSLGLDPGVGQVVVDHIKPENLHEGPHRSLLEQPIEAFPNCSVMAYVTIPSGEQFDQFDTSDITLFAETMVIAGPVPKGQEVPFETIVHRRIQRTTEAVNAVIKRSGTLLGTVNPIQSMPRGGIGNSSWLRPQEKGSGPRYLWHGSRLQYTLQRHAHFN